MDEDSYLEHGLSFYKSAGKLDLTPGHTDSAGVRYRTFAPDAAIIRCFSCHSTGSVRLGPNRSLVPFEPGVRCESCHGPGSDHASKPSAANIRNPGRLNGNELNQLCGTCHRMPPSAGTATNWRNPWNVRHQPVYLAASACFIKSEGKLSCLTCHATHTDTVREACASCHQKVPHKVSIANRSCASCHMPKVRPGPHLRFTNHWTGVYRLPADPLRPVAQRPRLSPAAALDK